MATVKVFENVSFVLTGWNPQRRIISLGTGAVMSAKLSYRCTNIGDQWARYLIITVNGIEVQRIVISGGESGVIQNLEKYLHSGENTFDVVITTQVGTGWAFDATLDYEISGGVPPPPPPACKIDSDCPAGYTCVNGQCVKTGVSLVDKIKAVFKEKPYLIAIPIIAIGGLGIAIATRKKR